MDSSSLINIQRNFGITALEKVKDEILIPEQVKMEVADHPKINKKDSLRKFVLDHPEIVVTLGDEEEERFFELLTEPGIDSGEAAAMAVALLTGC